MLENGQLTKNTAGLKPHLKKPVAPKVSFYQTRNNCKRGFDDFWLGLAAMKERGDIIISGRRIC